MEPGPLTDALRETVAVFEDAGVPMTTSEVADRLDLGRRSAYDRLDRLVERGHIETKKVGAKARVWYRPQPPTEASRDDGSEDTHSALARGQRAQQFRSLVEATEEYAIFLLDANGYVQTWNPGAERIKGYAADEIVGEHFSTFYTEAAREAGVPAANLDAAADDGAVEDEGWRVRSDGTRFWANVTITALRDDDGDLTGYAKVTRDMTDRREYERRLEEEKALVESLLDTQQDLFYAYDADGTFSRWSESFSEVTGYADEEIGTMQLTEFIAEEAHEETAAAVERILEDGDTVTVELPLATADGEVIPYEFTGGPIKNQNGDIVGATGSGRDVSDRRAREEQLRRQRDELQAELDDVFQRIDDAFFALDDDWRFTHVNERAATVLDRSAESLLGRTIWEAFPETVGSPFQAQYERAMATQESVTFEEYYPPLDTWFEVAAYPSTNGLSVYFRDVSDRKERERELERYEAIVSTIQDGVYVLDEEFRFTQVNDAYVEMTGYAREELLGTHCSLVVDDDVVAESAEQLEAVIEDADGGGLLEAELQQADGGRLPAESRFTALSTGGADHHKVGVVRDVSDRKERERALRNRVRQQEVVADLGQRALEDRDLDALMADATELVADTLDNAYCKVLDLDADAEELLLRQGVGWDDGIVGEATVSAVADDSQAAYTLATEDPVVVPDLAAETRFSGPDLLTDHDVRSGISTIIGSPDNPWGILGTHDTEPRDVSDHDAAFVQSIANILASAIDRHGYERGLIEQRERLAALNSLSTVAHDITDAVIDRSTREEIERIVCEQLAASDSYAFAWIGEVDTTTQTVTLRTEAGVEGYLDDITISVDPDDDRSGGPTGRALRTGDLQVVQDSQGDGRHDPWREHVEQYAFESSAAVPIAHEGVVYGVLNIYTGRARAFEGQERDVVRLLGEVVGHAIGAAERKQALMSDDLVELEFRLPDVFGALDLPTAPSGTLALDSTVPLEDGEYLVYGTATPDALETVEALVEAVPHWDAVTVRSDGDPATFELRLTDPPILSVVTAQGGYVDSAVIEDGDYRLTIHLAPSVDTRRVIDAVETTYPQAEMLRHRQITRSDSGARRAQQRLLGDLTDRQQTVLEAAYYSGFFEWPRDNSGEDVAESLGISPPTFHQHLREAERKVFQSVLASPP